MAGLVGRISPRQVSPRSARAQDPENGIEHVSGGAPWAAPFRPRPAALLHWEVGFYDSPLLLRQIHPDGRSKFEIAVEPDGEVISDRGLTAARL